MNILRIIKKLFFFVRINIASKELIDTLNDVTSLNDEVIDNEIELVVDAEVKRLAVTAVKLSAVEHEIKNKSSDIDTGPSSSGPNPSNSVSQSFIKLPTLKIPIFEDNGADPLSFYRPHWVSPHSVKPKETFQQQKTKTQYIQQNNKVSKSQYYGGCKFCLSLEHSSTHCKKYIGHEERVRRASQLNLCTLCLSPKHSKERCYRCSEELSFGCKSCLSNGHVTPLCPKMVLSLTATKVVESKGNKK